MEDNKTVETDPNKQTEPVKTETQPAGEDVSGLKSALQKEREARKAMEAKIKEFEAKKNEAEIKALEEKDQWKEVAEKYKTENQQLKAAHQAAEKRSFAANIISDLTADKKKSNLLMEQVLKHVDYDEGAVKITGLADIGSPDEMKTWLREEFAFLVDGNKASGGGAAAATGGGAAKKEIRRSDFEKLSPMEQMKVSKEGYSIIRD